MAPKCFGCHHLRPGKRLSHCQKNGRRVDRIEHCELWPSHYADYDEDDASVEKTLKSANRTVKRVGRLKKCNRCILCERDGDGAKPFSKCRATPRRMRLWNFIDNPLSCCPIGKWLPEYPLLQWPKPTMDHAIVIGSDDNAAWAVELFVPFLRKHTGCMWPVVCADFGLSDKVKARLPVDQYTEVPGKGLHPMYRKAAAGMFSGARIGVWYDTDILVRVHPVVAAHEMLESGHDLAIRRGELWWKMRHRADNWHTGVYAFAHGSLTLRHWASWSMAGDRAWITADDPHHIRDEELFAELVRVMQLPVHDLDPIHARLPSEFHAEMFGMPDLHCENDNWHFPGKQNKEEFKALASGR